MIEIPSDDPLRPWRPGAEVPEGEAALWQAILAEAGGDTIAALVRVRHEAEAMDAEDRPYRAVELWSVILRQMLVEREPTGDADLEDIRELAEAIRHAGNRRTLVPLYQWLFEAWRKREGEHGPNTSVAKVQLGYATGLSGSRREGVAFLREGLAATMAAYGETDRRTIEAMIFLAETLDDLGEDDAEPRELAQKALESAQLHIGANDRLTLWCAQRLASILISFGERHIAISLTRTTLEAARATLGGHHVRTLFLSSFLGTRVGIDGGIFEGFDLCIEALEGLKNQLGLEHPNTLTVLNHVAASHSRIGDSRRARDLRSQNLRYRMKVFGSDHPRTWLARNDLGFAARQAGDLSTAMSMYQQVFDFRRRSMPNSRPTQLSINNLAFTLMELNRYEEALKLFKLNYRLRRKRNGANKPATVLSLKNLGLCLVNSGRADEGLSFLLEALERRIALPGRGPDHQSVAIVWRDLAKAYRALERHPEAEQALEEALRIDTAKRGETHSRTVRTTSELIRTVLLADKPDRAASLLPQHLQRLAGLMPGGLNWFGATRSAAEHVSALLSRGHSISWVSIFRELGSRYVELIDLTDPEEVGYLRGHYARFHAAWLSLCLTAPDGAGEIPRVLSAISGRETAALVLAELEARGGAFAEGDPRRQYLEVLRELRRLRMMLRAQSEAGGDDAGGEGEGSGDGDGAGGSKRRARLDPEMAESIRQSRAAFRADLAARHDAAMARYKALRAELTATDETFARAYAAPDTSTESLAQLLRPGEGLALLFGRRDADGQEHHHACCVTPDGAVTTLPLPELGTALSTVAALSRQIEVEQINRGGLRGGREMFVAAEPVDPVFADAADGLVQAAELPVKDLAPGGTSRAAMTDAPGGAVDLAALMRAGLWGPLTAHLPDVHAWHIATHQELHLLPVHLGLDGTRRCTAHPGLVFFWLNRRAAAEPVPVRPRLLIHVDPAEGSAYPIPFVEVEAELLRSIWGADAVEVVRSEATIARLQAAEPTVDTMVFVAHGNEIKGPPRTTVISASAIRGLQIDANTLLSAAQRPRSAVASACVVGRVSEDEGGEPLGLVSAFFVSGGRFVVAPLQPVSDLYMPIFMGLFHLAWRDGGDPAQAIVTARRQALSGDWPAGFADLVREAYRSGMTRQIENAFAQRDDREQFRKELADIEKSWLLPWPWSARIKNAQLLENGANLTGMDIKFYGPAERANLVTAAIEAMLPGDGQKAPVPPALRAIVDWTVAFGD